MNVRASRRSPDKSNAALREQTASAGDDRSTRRVVISARRSTNNAPNSKIGKLVSGTRAFDETIQIRGGRRNSARIAAR
jgi:hypothetical protein